MGHYYAEMMCEKCGRVRCSCPPTPPSSKENWFMKNGKTVAQWRADFIKDVEETSAKMDGFKRHLHRTTRMQMMDFYIMMDARPPK